MEDYLMCAESLPNEHSNVWISYEDPVLISDERVLSNLLKNEERYQASHNYFQHVQSDLQQHMRRVVALWMLDVCSEEKCEDDVFPLAMNYLDRFLSIVDLNRCRLQLLGAVCMFIASKLKNTVPLSANKLVAYTQDSVRLRDVIEMELLVLMRLRWDMSAVTPQDILDQIIARVPMPEDASMCRDVTKHARFFISLCTIEFAFQIHPPSMISAASLLAAMLGMLGTEWVENAQLPHCLHKIIHVETDCLFECQRAIEQTANTYSEQMSQKPHGPGDGGTTGSELPTTPTDVRDVTG